MLELARDVTLTEVEGGAVVLDGRHGRYWQLNPMATAMLGALLRGRSEEFVTAEVSRQVAVPAEKVRADVHELVRALLDARLVVRAP